MTTGFCGRCGTARIAGGSFCAGCGSALEPMPAALLSQERTPLRVPDETSAPSQVKDARPAIASGSVGRRILPLAGILALVAVAGGVTWFVQRETGTEQAIVQSSQVSQGRSEPSSRAHAPQTSAEDRESPSETTSPSSTSSEESTSGTSALTEEQALIELHSLRAASLSNLAFDGRWVAQVASKNVGISDPLQVAANGTHTFYAVDILVESRAAHETVSDPSDVLVLQSTDFGKRSAARDGQPFWVTLVDGGFMSSEQVDQWCASTYPNLTTAQLANACTARTLSPPHD